MPKKTTGQSSIALEMTKLVELLPGMVTLYNINSGQYVYVNRAVKNILDYSPEDFMKKGLEFVASLVHPDDFPEIMKKNQLALKEANSNGGKGGRDSIVNFEYRMRHKDGHWVWLHTDGVVYDRTPDGKVNHVMNVSLDITHRKKVEESLEKSTDELKVLNSTKDEFITIASHQLRTPATAIKQYLGLLLGGYSDPLTADQKNFLNKAYDSNQRQLDIVEDILRTAQLDADKLVLKIKSTDIVKLLDEAVEVINPQFKAKNQTVHWSKPSKALKVSVDAGHILMVLENILENASHYSEKDKRVSISLRSTPRKIMVTIADQGVGIKQSDIDKLFKKFSRIRNPLSVEAGGTGLGLYWAERIVSLHEGRISVSSVLKKGTKITITLPRAD